MNAITELVERLRSFAKLGELMEKKTGRKTAVTKALYDAAVMIEELSAKLSASNEWIPCSERLPEKYIGEWLCSTSDGDVMILPYDTPGDGTKECVFYEWDEYGCYYQTFDVVAWMPLPEPYRGKTGEERKDNE